MHPLGPSGRLKSHQYERIGNTRIRLPLAAARVIIKTGILAGGERLLRSPDTTELTLLASLQYSV